MTLSYRHLAALSLLSLAACAAESDAETNASEADISSIKSYFADAKKLDLTDLTRVSVGFATDGLNDALYKETGTLHGGIKFEAPSVFAATAEPNKVLPDQYEVKALDTIVSGLAAQFGESELGTQVNKVRLNHVSTTEDKFFVESGFTTGVGIGPSWNINAQGFANTGVTLGFNADALLTSRVIVATKTDKLGDLVDAPLAAVKAQRGFIYPRSMNDVRGMKPGEMFALRGQGQLGANFGVGAPIFVAAAGPLGYQVVVSAGVAGVVSGEIDVQLVRLEGDEVVVDVGVEKGHGVSFHAGISDQWGIKGICEDGQSCLRDVNIAGKAVGLRGLVEKAVANQVNRYLTFSIDAGASEQSSRVSLSRFRFHMDKGDKAETEKALQQLLKFDLRLAQALYNRDLDQAQPAITADFDAVRAATTTSRNFGFELLGMNIYHKAVVQKEGTFVLQTPDGAKSILFDQLQKDGGWFEKKHAFTRTGVGAESIQGSKLTSEANLFVQTLNSDSHMDNDFAIDNIDALLLGIGGRDLVDTLDTYGNKLQQTLWAKCPAETQSTGQSSNQQGTKVWHEDCNVKLLDDPSFKQIKIDGLKAIESKMSGLSDEYKSLVRTAADVRLTLQSTGIHNYDAMNGCNVAFSTDVRFDDSALATLTSRSKDEYLKALKNYIGSVNQDRMTAKSAADKDAAASYTVSKSDGAVEAMANVFAVNAQAYNAIAAAEKGLPSMLGGKKFIAHPVAVRFTVDNDMAKSLESAQLVSTSTDRAKAAAKLYDDLRDAADDLSHLDLDNEQAALYPLIALVPAKDLDVAMTLDTKIESSFFVHRDRFIKAGLKDTVATAHGANASSISAGMFDLKAMIDANK
jgi:hypothetical protein